MKTQVYYTKKSKITQSRKLSDQQKETQKFNLWIDMIHSNLNKS